MTTAPPTRYAAIYARVSTEDQGKGFSIPTQIEACQKLAEREGYTVPEAYVLIDEGISGTRMDRPGLRQPRALVQTRTISGAMVYDPDRLSRNPGHRLLLAEELERADVKLLIVSHPLEQGPEGRLFFQMRGLWRNMSGRRSWSGPDGGLWDAFTPGMPGVRESRSGTATSRNRLAAAGKSMTRWRHLGGGSLPCA